MQVSLRDDTDIPPTALPQAWPCSLPHEHLGSAQAVREAGGVLGERKDGIMQSQDKVSTWKQAPGSRLGLCREAAAGEVGVACGH